jgi:WD40 repeat protein
LWSINTGEFITTIGRGDNVNAFAFSPNNRLIVTVNQDGSIRFWDLNSYRSILNITGRGKSIDCVSFSPDSEIIAVSSQDVIQLWNVSNGHLLLTLDGSKDCITNLTFSPDGKLLVSSSKDAQIKVWKLSTSRQDNYVNRKIEYDMSMIPF